MVGPIQLITDLIRYRELLYSLTVKELKVRYKNAVLGFLWAILTPLLMMVVLTVVFGYLGPREFTGDIKHPFSVFLLCALIPWTFFAHSLSNCTGVLIGNADLIKKVYFPREVIPVSTILAAFINYLLSLVVLFAFLIAFRKWPTVWILALPVIVFVQTIFVLGICLMVSSLNAFYRDVAYIAETALMLWFYATPIFYSHTKAEQFPLFFRFYMLNPMAAIVISMRNILLDGRCPDILVMLPAILVSIAFFVAGAMIFRKQEPLLADHL